MKKKYALVLALIFTLLFYFFHSFTGFVVYHNDEQIPVRKDFYKLDSLFIEPGKLIFQDYNITEVFG